MRYTRIRAVSASVATMFFVIFLITATTIVAGTSGDDVRDLMRAVEGKDTVKVKELLNTVDVTAKDEFGLNVLYKVGYSNGEITRLLMSRGAGRMVNELCSVGEEAVSPLFHACYVIYEYPNPYSYEILEALLKAGDDANAADSNRLTPLHLMQAGPEARLLISYGADANAKDKYGHTPIFTCFSGKSRKKMNMDVLEALAEADADFAIGNDSGNTIFHLHSDRHVWTREFVAFLARNGVPLDAVNGRGETALTKVLKRHAGAPNSSIGREITSYENLKHSFYAYMAEAGADLNAPNQYGETLLLLAVLKYRAGMAKWLLENGADVEAKNADGHPPLLALAKREKWNSENPDNNGGALSGKRAGVKIKAVIDVLVQGGAKADFRDEEGRDAGYYFRKAKMISVDRYVDTLLKKDSPELMNCSCYPFSGREAFRFRFLAKSRPFVLKFKR